jgi:hypothetical protein
MKIKVGEYVRLQNGEIFKIDENTTNYYNSNKDYITNDITKHSKNIIDVIEVGDYVNGYKVLDIAQAPKKALYLENIRQNSALLPIEDIETIVTHEQFAEMEYKV